MEKRDDMRLADGSMAKSENLFQDSYELTGHHKCHSQRKSHPVCKELKDQFCQNLFSQMNTCREDPRPFMVSRCECDSRLHRLIYYYEVFTLL